MLVRQPDRSDQRRTPSPTPSSNIEELELVREVECIDFEVGDNVVYPHHGAGQVVKKEDKNILGEVRQYLTIKILHNDMTVMVPCENAGKAGLRRVIDEETVKKVLAVLSDDVSEMPKNWNRRFKHNRDKIKTGDIYELAEVVRNLAIREQDKGLSTGEKQMYTRAKKILASELMYALEKSEDEAEAYLDGILVREKLAARDGLRPGARRTMRRRTPPRSSSRRGAANAWARGSPRRSSPSAGGRWSRGRSTRWPPPASPRAVVAVPPGHGAAAEDALALRGGRLPARPRPRGGRRDPVGVRPQRAWPPRATPTRSSSTTRRGRSSTPELFARTLAALADADAAIAAAPGAPTP